MTPLRPRVMIESPFAAPTLQQRLRFIRYAEDCCRDSLARGEAPFATHLFYPNNILDEDIPSDRLLGLGCGKAWLQAADYVAIYRDFGISLGMNQAIESARTANIPYLYRNLYPLTTYSPQPLPEDSEK